MCDNRHKLFLVFIPGVLQTCLFEHDLLIAVGVHRDIFFLENITKRKGNG